MSDTKTPFATSRSLARMIVLARLSERFGRRDPRGRLLDRALRQSLLFARMADRLGLAAPASPLTRAIAKRSSAVSNAAPPIAAAGGSTAKRPRTITRSSAPTKACSRCCRGRATSRAPTGRSDGTAREHISLEARPRAHGLPRREQRAGAEVALHHPHWGGRSTA